jgi:hypothetical protein
MLTAIIITLLLALDVILFVRAYRANVALKSRAQKRGGDLLRNEFPVAHDQSGAR